MKHQASDEVITVLKELYKGKKFTQLRSRQEVEEILMAISFMLMAGSAAKNSDDKKAQSVFELLEKVGGELKEHLDDLDLDDLNKRMQE